MSSHPQPSFSKWVGAFAGGAALMGLGGWVSDQRRGAAETVKIEVLEKAIAAEKQDRIDSLAEAERNSIGRSLANREEYLRMDAVQGREIDRVLQECREMKR